MADWAKVYNRLKARIESYGIAVEERRLGFETTGVFDGLSITTNIDYDKETRCHNIAHSVGHIVQWSLDYPRFQKLYDDLNAAKSHKAKDPASLERALLHFRDYEEEASRYAAWLLGDSGSPQALADFTNFARADTEAIAGFHRHGIAPIWHDFFADWNQEVTEGRRLLTSFQPKPIPNFTPRLIPVQEVIQEVDGKM